MIVTGNEKYVDLIATAAAAKMAEQKLDRVVEELKEQLKRIESKQTLGIRLTKEEKAIWLLYGNNKR